MLSHFVFDFWTFVGIASQMCFIARFIWQWYETERHGKVIVPMGFWYLSLLGSSLLFAYALQRQDIVFFSAASFQALIFSRNLYIAHRHKRRSQNTTADTSMKG